MNTSLFGNKHMARGEWEEEMLARVDAVCREFLASRGGNGSDAERHEVRGKRDGLCTALGVMIGLTGPEVYRAWVNADRTQTWGLLRSLGEEQRLKGITGIVGKGW